MTKKDFSDRILVGITGSKERDWKNKLHDINKRKISKVALFLECFNKPERKKIYKSLLSSKIKKIPLVHIRHGMDKAELNFLKKNFGTTHFTIHESNFNIINRWKGFYKHLFLEMNFDNFIPKSVKVNRIGGFCVDLAHFKVEEERWTKEFEYIFKREKIHRYFACNHLNGYSYKKNIDLHQIKNLNDFNYLKTLPKFLFGDIIALETLNGIPEQLKFKKYLSNILNNC